LAGELRVLSASHLMNPTSCYPKNHHNTEV
jgi:hypothetical protein